MKEKLPGSRFNVSKTGMSGLVLLCVLTALGVGAGVADKPDVDVLGLFAYRGSDGWSQGHVVIPAAELAVRHVNLDPSTLPDYNLVMRVRNGGCDERIIIATSVGEAFLADKFMGVVGAACTRSTITMARILNRVGICQVPFGAELSELSDTTLYPYLFRTSISLSHVADGYALLLGALSRHSVVAVAQVGTWTEVARFSAIKLFLEEHRIRVVHLAVFGSDDSDTSIDDKLEEIRKLRKHMILSFLVPDIAQRVICRAYKKGMTAPNFFWIQHLPEGVLYYWDQPVEGEISCTLEERRKAHFGSLVHILALHTVNQTRYYNFVHEYQRRLAAYLVSLNYVGLTQAYPCLAAFIGRNTSEISNAPIESLACLDNEARQSYVFTTYDSVWVLARALHNAEMILKTQHNLTLKDYKPGLNIFSQTIKHSLSRTDFNGISGTIQYQMMDNQTLDKNTRAVRSAFFLVTPDNVSLVAEYDGSMPKRQQFTSHKLLEEVNQTIPSDETINYPLLFIPQFGYLCVLLNIIFLVTLSILVILNNVYFDHQPFKGSDGILTNFQVGFLILLTTGTLLNSIFASVHIDNAIAFGTAANCTVLMVETGLVMFLCIAVSKSYRLYYIFVNYLKARRISSLYVMIFVVVMLVVTLVYDVIGVAAFTLQRSPEQRCHVVDGVIVRCFYYSVSPRYFSYIALVFTICACIFLFWLGVQGWSIKDPRFYDIHNNAMLSAPICLTSVIMAVAIPVLPFFTWPFGYAAAYTWICGLFIQGFFVFPLFWKLYTFHCAKSKIKCHCMTSADFEKPLHSVASNRRISYSTSNISLLGDRQLL